MFPTTTHSNGRRGSQSISSASPCNGSSKISTGWQCNPAWTPLKPSSLCWVAGRSQSSPQRDRHEEHQASRSAAAGCHTYLLTRWGNSFFCLSLLFIFWKILLLWTRWVSRKGSFNSLLSTPILLWSLWVDQFGKKEICLLQLMPSKVMILEDTICLVKWYFTEFLIFKFQILSCVSRCRVRLCSHTILLPSNCA